MQCKKCGKDTKNPKFCSMSCSVSYTNKTNPKRKLTKKCKRCKNLVKSPRVYCKQCYSEYGIDNYTIINKTLDELICRYTHRSSAYVKIRNHAKYWMKKWKTERTCKNCGYNKHVEVCHIKPIASFSKDTKISIINAKGNLLYLCPNCHWELDNLK